jgi:hypothetical protein
VIGTGRVVGNAPERVIHYDVLHDRMECVHIGNGDRKYPGRALLLGVLLEICHGLHNLLFVFYSVLVLTVLYLTVPAHVRFRSRVQVVPVPGSRKA